VVDIGRPAAVAAAQELVSEGDTVKKKLVIFMLIGPDNPRRAATPFLVAMAALASDWEVSIYFACDGVLLLKRGVADKVYALEVGRSLAEFMQDTADLGAKYYACPPAMQLHNLTVDEFIDGIETAGAASLLQDTQDADTVLTI
jgi:predicted peroxiredoxin